MTPQELLVGTNSPQVEPECGSDDVTTNYTKEMEQLMQNRRVDLRQRHLTTRWAERRPRPQVLDVHDMKCFMIKKMFLKDRYNVDAPGLDYCPPTAPHRKHLRIKSGTDGRKYVPMEESAVKPRLVKSATTTPNATWRGYHALNRPNDPDPIPQLFTASLQKDRSQREEHLQQWRNQVVKKVLIKRQKYSIPIDPTAPRIRVSVDHSRNTPLPPHQHRRTPEGQRVPPSSPHPRPVSVTSSSEEAVIGVPTYWKNTQPKYRSHLQAWRIPRL